ncbi:hypothetical protein [Mycobacteroides sp. LB1]|uniref:hypothetical protein n=1 Tax=Mycobacteroides sp. LB1 TaxID=2750814 RepID=UPI0015E01472|nr:hypothetical protein [Mycobacteroides sp. LB1]
MEIEEEFERDMQAIENNEVSAEEGRLLLEKYCWSIQWKPVTTQLSDGTWERRYPRQDWAITADTFDELREKSVAEYRRYMTPDRTVAVGRDFRDNPEPGVVVHQTTGPDAGPTPQEFLAKLEGKTNDDDAP